MMKAWMMVQTFLLVLVSTQLSWTQKDTSVQPDMDDISVSPSDLPTVSDSPRNDNGEEAYDDHENLGRKLQPLKFSKTKLKLKQKDGSDGDLTKHEFGNRHKRRRTKKKLRSRNKKKAQKLKSHDQTKDKKQQFKNKMSNDLQGDAHHPVVGTKAAAPPHLSDASLGEHTVHPPFIGARAAALPSQSSPGTDASQIRNPSAKNSDTFYQDKLYQLQMLTEDQNAATLHSSTSPYLHSYHLQTDDLNYGGDKKDQHEDHGGDKKDQHEEDHGGDKKDQHEDLGGAYKDKKDDLGGAYSYNTHDSSDWELASTLSQLSSDLSETRSKIESKLTTLQNRLKERQDSLRQVRSLITMMVYGSGYPSYP